MILYDKIDNLVVYEKDFDLDNFKEIRDEFYEAAIVYLNENDFEHPFYDDSRLLFYCSTEEINHLHRLGSEREPRFHIYFKKTQLTLDFIPVKRAA